MVTTKQLASFAKQNQYVQAYYSMGTYYRHRWYDEIGRNPYVRYWSGFTTDISTHQKNTAYRLANDAIKHRFNIDPSGQLFFKVYLDGDTDGFYFHCSLRWEFNGKARVCVSLYQNENGVFNRLPYIGEYSYSFAYTGVLSEDAATEATRKEIESKFMFAPGKWRDIQLLQNKTKDDVVRLYRYWLENYPIRNALAYDEGEMLAWLKRKKNLSGIGYAVTTDDAVKFFKFHKGFTKPMALSKYDGSWMFDFDGDIDEIEAEFYDTLKDNTVYL